MSGNLTIAPETLEDAPDVQGASGAVQAPSHPRYMLERVLGSGGMGEVWRAWDRQLERHVALKALRSELLANGPALTRFVEEARSTARLQHPGIVPVYDAGVFDDGRPYFTMREIRGRTFTDIIADLHASSGAGGWATTSDGWTFLRLVDGFRRACDAVAHAHARGFVHRDLKPDNLMAGPHGEILVLDWGIAALTQPSAAFDPEVSGLYVRPGPARSAAGIAGTPAWMAPEQARGEPATVASDVHALGAVLHAILFGGAPFAGADVAATLRAVLLEARVPVAANPRVPDELVSLVDGCLQPDVGSRPADAAAIAVAVRDWQEGARRRAEADAHVAEAVRLRDELARTIAAQVEARRAAVAAGANVPAWKPVSEKAALWALEDEARALEERVAQLRDDVERELDSALARVGDHPAAHAALADVFRAELEDAEAARDQAAARRAAARVAQHDRTGSLARWLQGDGTLSIATDVPARARLYRVERQGRRAVAVPSAELGITPLVGVALGMGSWLVELEAEGRERVRVPVALGRAEAWPSTRPDGTPLVVRLPERLPPGVAYVPEGPFRAGGDPSAATGRAASRPWVGAFVIDRHPVTNGDWIAFLDDLVANGREDDALRAVPRVRDAGGQPVYGRDADGRFVLVADGEGDLWAPDWPVMLVDAEGAEIYARWRAARDGLPWRLPHEDAWEKAARGVDGRWFPWGDHFDPSWACVRESHAGRLLLATVHAFPGDESIYGVRGMAGGVRTLCHDGAGGYVARGGAWSMVAASARSAQRAPLAAHVRTPTTGVRLVCAW